MNSEITQTQFEYTWGRVKQLTGWTEYKQLADFVGSSSQSINGVKKRGKFPLEWARKIARGFDSYTDYLMDGEGPMNRGEIKYDLAEGLKNTGSSGEPVEGRRKYFENMIMTAMPLMSLEEQEKVVKVVIEVLTGKKSNGAP